MGKTQFGKNGKLYFGSKAAWDAAESLKVRDVSINFKDDVINTTHNQVANNLQSSVLGQTEVSFSCSGDLLKSTGVPLLGKATTLTVDSVAFPIVDFEYSEQYGKDDCSETGAQFKSSGASRGKITAKLSAWVYGENADLTGSGKAFVITFDTGYSISGTADFSGKTITGSSSGFDKVSYSMEVNTSTKTLSTLLAPATEQDFELNLEQGGVTSKDYKGRAYISQLTIKTSKDTAVTVDYQFEVTGAVEENKREDE